MMGLRALLLLTAALAMAGCAQMPSMGGSAAVPLGAPERQLLVMLRAPPPHFRPDTDYSFAYGPHIGRAAEWRLAEEVARRHDLEVVTAWPMPALGVDCFVMQARGPATIPALAAEIARDPRVESAQAMNVFRALGHDDPLSPLQPVARLWHIEEIHRLATGRNVRIAEVDSAVEVDHPDLRGRVAAARDFIGDAPPIGEVHGTAIAGIIAARAGDGIGIAGVAPDASLVALRACRPTAPSSTSICTSFTLAKALQYALDQDVQVINLSLGGPSDALLARLIDVAIARRIIVVAAADPEFPDGGFPASHRGVLAVAAAGAQNAPEHALVAPGRDIPATMPGRSWGFVNGSSFAAAEVSGAVALVLERAPGSDADAVRRMLTAEKASDAGNHPPAMVDICSAMARLAGTCACRCSVVARDVDPDSAH